MTHIDDGLVLAGYDTVVQKYNGLVTDEFKKTNTYYHNKYISDMRPILLCYGAELVKPSLKTKGANLHKSASKKITGIYNEFHIKDNPFFIDSGGFQICRGYVPPSYVDYLSEYYTNFIKETSAEYPDMQYFFLDIIPTNGITKDFAQIKMKEFYDLLVKKASNSLDRIFLVMHCNAISAYDTFYKFIRDNNIHQQLNSHKYAVGGMVPLNFNQSNYIVRPYMVAIFDMIELELENLKNNIPVYFHILGTSSTFEMICISWLNILCHYYNLPLTITFDSTTYISNTSRSGILHYISDNEEDPYYITCFDTKYSELNKTAYNRPIQYTNKYYLDKVRAEITDILKVEDPNETWFDSKGRWTNYGSNAMNVYEAWAFGKIFDYVKKKCNDKKDWIIYENQRGHLKQLVIEIMKEISSSFNFSGGRKSFDSNTCSRLIQSLNWFDLALKNKLPDKNRSYNLVNSMFNQNTNLMTNQIIKFDSQKLIQELAGDDNGNNS